MIALGPRALFRLAPAAFWCARMFVPLRNTMPSLVGGDDAMLVVDNTALPKKGRHSVGVAPQYATVLGK